MVCGGLSPKVILYAMKMTYDPQADTLRILFRSAPIHDSETHRGGLILDFDQQGKLVGLELAAASTLMSRPETLEFPTGAPSSTDPGALDEVRFAAGR